MSHGESAWVAEVAFHAAESGLVARREVTVGGAPRVDLELAGAAVEFKSFHAGWAFSATDEARADWFGGDIRKLRCATVPSLMVITAASLGSEATHQRTARGYSFDPTWKKTLGHDPAQILDGGLDAAERFLTSEDVACSEVRRVRFPEAAELPSGVGEVHLGAVIGVVG
jgi:hypothetical protein